MVRRERALCHARSVTNNRQTWWGRSRRRPDRMALVLLCAHYDSKSQLMPVAVRATFYMLGFSSAILLGLTLFVAGIMAAAGKDTLGSQAGFYVSLVPALLIFALVFNRTGNKSPGALDDASGEAVILEAARLLAQRPLENLDVRIISFGLRGDRPHRIDKVLARPRRGVQETPALYAELRHAFLARR